MKKLLYIASLLLVLGFASCEKEEIGGTATQKVAGEWYVTVDAVLTDGDTVACADFFEVGEFYAPVALIHTFNTASNIANKMYVSDSYGGYSNFSDLHCYQVEVDLDQAAGTFQTKGGDFVQNMFENYNWKSEKYNQYSQIKIINGKITLNGGVQNNGSAADAISYELYIKGNYYDVFPEREGTSYWDYNFGIPDVDHFYVSGIRYSGLVEND